jgi:histidyl-tRNA synthetase
MRALDKYDRLGRDGVGQLLGAGRKDDSGDFTQGAGLDETSIKRILQVLTFRPHQYVKESLVGGGFNPIINTGTPGQIVQRSLTSSIGNALRYHAETTQGRDFRELEVLWKGLEEIEQIGEVIDASGFADGRIIFDPSVVRGLEYYTGPVFEAELTFEVKNEDGQPVRFGSVGGGGRYDDLVARFTGQKVPATGFSIGVSRLQAALAAMGKSDTAPRGPVVVTVMDKDQLPRYQALTKELRDAGIAAELYLGNPKKFGRQLEYADKRGSPCVIIQGSDERTQGLVQIKDLIEGAKAAAAIANNKEWKETRAAQVSVPEAEMVATVREILARHGR